MAKILQPTSFPNNNSSYLHSSIAEVDNIIEDNLMDNGLAAYTESDGGTAKHSSCNYRSYHARLESYKTWKSSFPIVKLAKAGFYYTGFQDIVRCPFCFIEGHNWKDGDNPNEDHALWRPNCEYVKETIIKELPQDRGQDVCIRYDAKMLPTTQSKELEKLGIPRAEKATHPTYVTLEKRLESFETWPKALKQKPTELAEAGFYYTGTGDHTICFHCGGGLKDWEDNDDPFEEHATWFPECNYIYLKKGPEFIKNMRKKGTASQEPEPSGSTLPLNTKEEIVKEKDDSESLATLCKICYKNELGVVFVPCGHLVTCVECAAAINECAVCRKPVETKVRSFLT